VKYLFLTNTRWPESPRIRHQLARLLSDNGDTVFFFEKASFRFWKYLDIEVKNVEDEKHIYLAKSCRFLHHRLSIFFLNNLDCFLINKTIKKFLEVKKLHASEVTVVNFVYDINIQNFGFKNIFFMLNDDFVGQTALAGIRYKDYYLKKSLSSSSVFLATSPILIERYKKWAKKAVLFMPWTEKLNLKYTGKAHPQGFLFFGHISKRLDWGLIEKLLTLYPNYYFDFYGDISNSSYKKTLYLIKKYPNVFFKGRIDCQDIDFRRYYGSITPYGKYKGDNTVYVTNKLFRMASTGLPSINAGMSKFMIHESIINTNTHNEFISACDFVVNNFEKLSKSSFDLAERHGQKQALSLFKSL
jgi:hypothetical protein